MRLVAEAPSSVAPPNTALVLKKSRRENPDARLCLMMKPPNLIQFDKKKSILLLNNAV
jgi:hypothetical protein